MNKRILSAFALLAALPAAAQLPDETANREHFFPLVADGGGFRSYLFLTNAADAANQCALALQGPNLDTGIFEANDAVTPAGAGATIDLLGVGASLTLISTAEQALAFGYATLECAEPVVARMLLTLSDNGSPIATTALESAQAGREFQFSVLPRLGRLGLLFSNDNSVAAACAVELEDAEGASAGGGNVALPAQSTALQFLGDLIPIPDGFDTGVVTLSCNEAIAVLGLPLNGATFTALPAISLDSGNTAQASHILPLIVDGDGFQSQLLVTNLAETANQCTMNLLGAGLDSGRFTNSGDVTVTGSGATLELADQGDTLSMLGSGEQALAFGYATLDCDQPATALNLLSVSAQGSPVGMAVIPSSRTAGSFAFPVVPQAGRLALVFTNDADTGASCTIELNDHEGGNAGRQSVPIAAKSTALRFLADLFDRVDEFPGGEAAVFCDPEVDAISLSLSGAVFAALPPTIFSSIELEPDLAPDFGNISFPQKEVYPRDTPIEPLQLPAAFGGNAPLRYSLEPAVPGLRFDAVTRQLTGTPTAAEVYKMHYLVEDADGDSDTHQFEISIVEPPASPSFADVSAPPDQTYALGKEIEPLQLPAAFGGDAPIVYLLEPEVPGLEFDSETRQLSGAPSATGVYTMSYSARDIDLDADTLEFNIRVIVPITSESLLNVNGCSNGSFVNNPNGDPELVSDCQSLVGFANALIETGLNAEDNVIRQWGSGDQVKLDTWDGVGVSGSRIYNISLRGRELKGDIPPHLGELSALINLNLSSNELSGPIPSELGALRSLTSLNLAGNQLSGPIPSELGALRSLTSLGLAGNQLSGPIPSELGALHNLTFLGLGANQLGGPIPSELGALHNLTYLGLGGNQLSGPIPSELGALRSLTTLSLWINQLSGPIPPELGTLNKLTYLGLGANQLSGPIPTELGNLTALTALLLYSNELSGPIPTELGELTELTSLQLRHNRLSGPIPAELGNLTALTALHLSSNELSGPIPTELGNLTALTNLNLGGNELSGPIPTELGNLTALTALHLYSNELSGPIPAELGNLTALTNLNLGGNELSGPIPTELGNLTALTALHLYSNELSGPIPAELGNLTALTNLDLGGNKLSGPIPTELGNLTALTALHLFSNELSGSVPQTFLQLSGLQYFYFSGNKDLCVSGVSAFMAWLHSIENRTERRVLCNESDRKALDYLFELTGGADWTNAEGWISGLALDERHGVQTDSLGRVTALDLGQNGLSGRLPASLGSLTQITELKIGGNPNLNGRFPLSLANFSIQALHYSGTDLCAPVDSLFQDWLNAVPSHEGTGEECARPSDREILEFLYDVTNGPNWTDNENWITDAPLGEWNGVDADDQGGVTRISFVANGLAGRIPRELGDLTHLQVLFLYRDRLTGPIPADLADLADLRHLNLGENDLTGPIPPELGGLVNLRNLSLHENDLTGSIPPELGNFSDLEILNLSANGLTGHIPPELGDLADLDDLNLYSNELSGPIPPELANLVELRGLNLAKNELTGRIPPEFSGLVNLERLYLGYNEFTGSLPPGLWGLMQLRTLALQANADISGTLPAALSNLVALETLQAEGTGLCAPSDAGLLEWLEGVAVRRVAFCEGEPAAAYLVQAVQSREFPVPLVAGEEALLRVFVTASRENSESLPPVRASFYRNGGLVHTADIPAAPGPVPTEVNEGSLRASVNAAVPADVVQPGLEMVVEVDPGGTLDAALGVARRIPATGRMAVDVRDMPVLDLTLVPFLWTEKSDSEVLGAVSGMAADPEGHELLDETRTLLPVGGLTVTAHEPVLSSSNDAYHLIAETRAIRVMEGETGYYMGMMSGDIAGAAGLGGGVASFSVPNASTIAHEFGHNFGLPHAPCGGARNLDAAYPHADGTTGAYGYDFRAGELVSPSRFDLMSYCDPNWVGDYNFTKATHFRLGEEGRTEASRVADAARSLLLWGAADSTGAPHLNPAFVVDAKPALPDSTGAYRIIGRNASGNEIFAFSFAMSEIADGDGSSSFAFALPVEPDWSGSLTSITLTGPGGSATLDAGSDQPMAILRNDRTGKVRGILRNPRFAAGTAATAADQGLEASAGALQLPALDTVGATVGQSLEILFSSGIPEAEAWQP